MPKIYWFPLLKCEYLLVFLVLCVNKFNIFGLELLVGQNKQFDEVLSGFWENVKGHFFPPFSDIFGTIKI